MPFHKLDIIYRTEKVKKMKKFYFVMIVSHIQCF